MALSLARIIEDLNNEQNFTIRVQAVSKLAAFNDADTLDLLLMALRDPYFRVREEAAQALIQRPDPRAIAPLVAAVTDIPAVRDAALEALQARTLSEEVVNRISSYLDTFSFYQRRKELTEVNVLKNESIEALTKALNDQDFLVREGAVNALGSLRDEKGFMALTDASNDLYLSVREAAIRNLQAYEGPLSMPVLLNVMNTTNWSLFDTLIDLMVKREFEHTVDVLVNLLQHENFVIRRRARAGLSKVPGTPILKTIVQTLREWDASDKAVPAYMIAQFYKDHLFDHVHYFSNAMMGLMGNIVERDWPKGIEALHQLADEKEWRHLAFFSTSELDRRNQFDVSTVLDKTFDLQRRYSTQYLCIRHLARFQMYNHDGNKYFGCRICKHTHTSIRASKLIALLDNSATEFQQKDNKAYRVNWLKHRTWMDFDAIEIGECSNDSITEFCIDIGNDTDSYRIQHYTNALCYIKNGTILSTESLNLLKNRFKKVIEL